MPSQLQLFIEKHFARLKPTLLTFSAYGLAFVVVFILTLTIEN